MGLQSRGASDGDGRLVKVKAARSQNHRDGGDQKQLRPGSSTAISDLRCSGFNYMAKPPVTFPSLPFIALGFLSC